MGEAESAVVCSTCGEEIDCCAFCDETGCGQAVCYGCLNVALGQAIAQPHQHGG